MKYVKLYLRNRRPMKWVITDSVLNLVHSIIQLIESVIHLLTLNYINISVSDSILLYNINRQLHRRKKHK